MPVKKTDYPKGLRQRRGSWFQYFYDPDRVPPQKAIKLKASTRARAEIERGRVIAAVEAGTLDPWKEKTPDVTIQEAVEAYMVAKAGLAPNSIRAKRQALTLFFASVPSKKRPAQITVEDFRLYFERSKLKASSQAVRLAECSTFFKWCKRRGYTASNPAREYKQERTESQSRFESKREEREGTRRGAIMPPAFRQLTGHISRAAMSSGAPIGKRHGMMLDLITFAVSTGLRRTELVHLCRRDVRLGPVVGRYPATGIVSVRCWENPRKAEHFRTKNGLDRRLRLVPVAARIAAQHLAQHVTEDDYSPLFLSPRGCRLQVASLTGWFGEYRVEAGLPDGTSFHSLRHSFASWLLMLGCDILLIQRFMGHSSLNQLEHYARLAESYVFGDASEVQREILMLLCPDLSPATVDRLMPGRAAFSETLRSGGLRRRRSVLPVEDVLFDGAAYELEEALNRDEKPADFALDLYGFKTAL